MKFSLVIVALALLASFPFAVTNVSTCTALNGANTYYTLNTSFSTTGGVTCFTVGANNVTLDCQGYTITGNNTSGSIGVGSNLATTTLKNCIIRDFQYAFQSGAGSFHVLDNITAYSNSTSCRPVWIQASDTLVNNSNITIGSACASYGVLVYNGGDRTNITNTISTSSSSSAAPIIVFGNGQDVNNVTLVNDTLTATAYYAISSSRGVGLQIISPVFPAPYGTVMSISSTNNTVDCQGRSYNGNAATYFAKFDTGSAGGVIKNCNLSNFTVPVYLHNSANSTVNNVTAVSTAGATFAVDGTSSGSLINNSSATSYSSYAINIAGGIVNNSYFFSNSTDAMYVSGSTNISNTFANSTGGSGVNLLASSVAVLNNVTTYCYKAGAGSSAFMVAGASLTGTGLYGWANGTASGMQVTAGTASVSNSYFYSNGWPSVYDTGGTGHTFTNVTSQTDAGGYAGFYITATGGNFQMFNSTGIGNSTSSGIGVIAGGNNINFTNTTGRALGTGSGFSLSGNNMRLDGCNGTSNGSAGISLAAGTGDVVVNSHGTSSTSYGLVFSASNSTVANTTIYSASGHAVRMTGSNNTIANSSVSAPLAISIYMDGGSAGQYINNTVAFNSTAYSIVGANTLIDCLGKSMSGSTGIPDYGVVVGGTAASNLTLKNCIISNATVGAYLANTSALTNNTFIGTRAAIQSTASGITMVNNTVRNTITASLSGKMYFPQITLPTKNLAFFVRASNNTDGVASSLNASFTDNSTGYASSAAFTFLRQSDSNSTSATSAYSPYPNEIWAYGDSLTQSATGYVSRVTPLLGVDMNAHNLGMGAQTCQAIRNIYAANHTSAANVTVTLECGANDAWANVSVNDTAYWIEDFYNMAVGNGSRVILGTAPPRDSEQQSCARTLSVNQWLFSFAANHSVPLVDFYPDIYNGTDCYYNASLSGDGTHPNALGAYILGNAFWHQGFFSRGTYAASRALSSADSLATYRVSVYDSNTTTTFEADYSLGNYASTVGNASNISASGMGAVGATINGTNSTNSTFSGTLPVNITSNGMTIVSFNYDFSAAYLKFSSISINNSTSIAVPGALFFSISGVNSTGGQNSTKTLYLYGASTAFNGICVYDAENISDANITTDCSGANEAKVRCDGTSQSGYTCTQSGTGLNITGLMHSSLRQYNFAAVSSGGSSASAVSLSHEFDCSTGGLEVLISPAASKVRVTLTRSGTTSRLYADTDSSGKAYFTIIDSGTYNAEASSGSYYGTLSGISLVLCPSAVQNTTNTNAPGSDRDSHGCIPSAGYTWCSITQKCIRPWEESCAAGTTQQNNTNVTPTEPEGKAEATAAVAQAETALSKAMKEGKDTTDAIWKYSAAKDALARGDYANAKQLASEALQLAANAAQRATGSQTGTGSTAGAQQPPAPSQPSGNWLGLSALVLLGAGVIIIAGAAGYFLFFRAKKGL